jgi:imidazole glycerol-phosphate synthase subunit HisF
VLRTRVIPCLLLSGTGLVKTVRFKNPTYVGDPVNAVNIFNQKEVDEVMVLDITATAERRPPPFQLISEVATECFMPLTYGGGVRSLQDMDALYRSGVEKVALNTVVADDPKLVQAAAERFGTQAVVVSIDARRRRRRGYRVCTNAGRRELRVGPAEYAIEAQRLGAGEILLTSIDRDGTMQGYDTELIRVVASQVDVPVVACGGAGGINDFRTAVEEGGASAVAAGSMVVFHGRNRAVLINFPSRAELEQVLS